MEALNPAAQSFPALRAETVLRHAGLSPTTSADSRLVPTVNSQGPAECRSGTVPGGLHHPTPLCQERNNYLAE